VRDVGALLRACAITPEYLRTAADSQMVNFRDWGIQLGRRFRALKLWFVIRSFGVEGLRERLRAHLALAQEFRGWVEADPDFEVVAPTPFALVCFRYRPKAMATDAGRLDVLNEKILSTVNASGRLFLTHTRLGGKYVLRLSIGALATQQRHVRAAWEELKRVAQDHRAGAGSHRIWRPAN
jgi:aromatic-L-amino-acid decarboxylase